MKPAVVYPLTKPEFDDNYSTNYAELLFVRPLYCTCCSSGHCIAHVVRPAIVLLMLFVRPLYCTCCSSGHCIAHVIRPAIVLHMLFVRPLYYTCRVTSSLAVFQNYCFCEGEENQNTNKWRSHYVVLTICLLNGTRYAHPSNMGFSLWSGIYMYCRRVYYCMSNMISPFPGCNQNICP